MKTETRRGKDQKRIPLSMRITPQMRNALVAAAANNGRSITQEGEFRIASALGAQHLLDQALDLNFRDPRLAAVLLLIGEAMRDAALPVIKSDGGPESEREGDWLSNSHIFERVADAVQTTLELLRPSGDRAPTGKITGRSIAGGIAARLLGNWSQHYPWPTIRDRLSPDIIQRVEGQWKQAVGPVTTMVPHWEDAGRVTYEDLERAGVVVPNGDPQ